MLLRHATEKLGVSGISERSWLMVKAERAATFCCLATLLLISSVGCEPPGTNARNNTESEEDDYTRLEPTTRKASSEDDLDNGQMMQRTRSSSGGYRSGLASDSSVAARESTEMAWKAVQESLAYEETLVVWLFDESPSASELVQPVIRDLARRYQRDLPKDEKLTTVVGQFSDKITWHIEKPSSDAKAIVAALESVTANGSEQEATFAAIQTAVSQFKSVRLRLGRSVVFVLVTDERGDDWQQVDSMITDLSRYQMPLYVIGSPAPFGYEHYGDDSEKGYGPESRGFEAIKMANWGGDVAMDVVDSGFGPFGLEWLCRQSGGVFLSVRPPQAKFVGAVGGSWPSGTALRFPKDVMEKYAPDYLTAEKYDAMVASNKAMTALVNAAKVGQQDMMAYPKLKFQSDSEAALARALTEAQKSAARLGPQVNRMYDLLKEGQRDREKITSPRWQAGYDLAFGRAAAAKVRVDGYNSMLAALKRGKTFENPHSTTWALMPDDSISVATTLQNISDRAREHLQRVVDEHPNTPWAQMAERELSSPIGWKWTEE